MDASLNGGVAQLGEHLPCKQGVKSSNLSISIRYRKDTVSKMYHENRISNQNEKISKDIRAKNIEKTRTNDLEEYISLCIKGKTV